MAFKVGTVTVVDNSKQLENIEDTDNITKTTIEKAIRAANNKLVIYDSGGNVVKTIYGPDEEA